MQLISEKSQAISSKIGSGRGAEGPPLVLHAEIFCRVTSVFDFLVRFLHFSLTSALFLGATPTLLTDSQAYQEHTVKVFKLCKTYLDSIKH
jgi:hypothetical protein